MALTTSPTNYLYRMGTAPNTRAAVSQKNKVFAYSIGAKAFAQLGVISEFGFDETRDVQAVRGVGFGDQIAELVPGLTEPMTVTLNKTLLYTVNLFQVVGYKGGVDGLVRSLRHHRWPFDIKQELVLSELSVAKDAYGAAVEATVKDGPTGGAEGPQTPISTPRALLTFFEGCWFNNYAVTFSSDSAIVAENGSCTVTDVIDGVSQYGEYIDTGLSPQEANGAPGKGYSLRFADNSNLVATGV